MKMSSTISDLELWERMRQDDASAFEEIYNRYAGNMFLYAMNIFKKQEVCEDIIQNIFMDFWIKRQDAEIRNLKSYLFQSVKFQVFKHLRTKRFSEADLTRLQIIDATMDVSGKIEYKELEHLINELVKHLSPRCRQIFIMSRFQNKTNAEIATALNISHQAVKNQISRALKKLKVDLAPLELIFHFITLCLIIPSILESLI